MKYLVLVLLLQAVVVGARAESDPVKPIREAWISGTLRKSFFKDGQFDLEPAEKVCDFRAKVPVYGLSKTGFGTSQVVICKTKIRGQEMKAQIFAVVNLMIGQNGEADYKVARFDMLVFPVKPGPIYSVVQGYVGSNDLNAKSLDVYVTSPSFDIKGRVDYFSVEANFED